MKIKDLSVGDLDAFIKEAQNKYDNNDFLGALDLLSPKIEIGLRDSNFLLLMGNISLKLGIPTRAIIYFGQCLEQAPDNIEACVNLAHSYHQINELSLSLKNFLKAVKLGDNSASSHYYSGLLYAKLHLTVEAIESYIKSYKLSKERDPKLQNIVETVGNLVKEWKSSAAYRSERTSPAYSNGIHILPSVSSLLEKDALYTEFEKTIRNHPIKGRYMKFFQDKMHSTYSGMLYTLIEHLVAERLGKKDLLGYFYKSPSLKSIVKKSAPIIEKIFENVSQESRISKIGHIMSQLTSGGDEVATTVDILGILLSETRWKDNSLHSQSTELNIESLALEDAKKVFNSLITKRVVKERVSSKDITVFAKEAAISIIDDIQVTLPIFIALAIGNKSINKNTKTRVETVLEDNEEREFSESDMSTSGTGYESEEKSLSLSPSIPASPSIPITPRTPLGTSPDDTTLDDDIMKMMTSTVTGARHSPPSPLERTSSY